MVAFVPFRAKELKARFGSFLLKQELYMGLSHKTDKLTLEDREKWSQSFHYLLAHKGELVSEAMNRKTLSLV